MVIFVRLLTLNRSDNSHAKKASRGERSAQCQYSRESESTPVQLEAPLTKLKFKYKADSLKVAQHRSASTSQK